MKMMLMVKKISDQFFKQFKKKFENKLNLKMKCESAQIQSDNPNGNS